MSDDLSRDTLAEAQAARLRRVWATPRGWRYWSAVNNTEVGIWYIVTSFGFFLFAAFGSFSFPLASLRDGFGIIGGHRFTLWRLWIGGCRRSSYFLYRIYWFRIRLGHFFCFGSCGYRSVEIISHTNIRNTQIYLNTFLARRRILVPKQG